MGLALDFIDNGRPHGRGSGHEVEDQSNRRRRFGGGKRLVPSAGLEQRSAAALERRQAAEVVRRRGPMRAPAP